MNDFGCLWNIRSKVFVLSNLFFVSFWIRFGYCLFVLFKLYVFFIEFYFSRSSILLVLFLLMWKFLFFHNIKVFAPFIISRKGRYIPSVLQHAGTVIVSSFSAGVIVETVLPSSQLPQVPDDCSTVASSHPFEKYVIVHHQNVFQKTKIFIKFSAHGFKYLRNLKDNSYIHQETFFKFARINVKMLRQKKT